MTLALYMDEHIRRAITNGLRLREVDVLTVQEDSRMRTPDPILLDRTLELNRVLFTQDDDFLAIASDRQNKGIDFNGAIYAHQQSVTVGDCVRDLEIIAKIGEPEDLANQIQYLPL